VSRKVRALSELDPARVPLPRGTDVATRVTLVREGREIPAGAAGRVVEVSDAGVVVELVGLGRETVDREDLVVRRVGQARFATRRFQAWEALAPTIVLRTVVGSRAWGLAEEGSDVDERGAFALPLGWTTGLVERSEDLISADGSATFWEIEKVIRQGLAADPNTLEMLFVPSAQASDELGRWLLDEREAFVSKAIFGRFARYAVAQLRRLEQAERLAHHRAIVLGWLRDEPALTLDAVAARLALEVFDSSSSEKILRAKEYLKELARSLRDRAHLTKADFASLVDFAKTGEAALEVARELRPKNAYNLLRLLHLADHWLRYGVPDFRGDRGNGERAGLDHETPGTIRARLFAIKRAEVPLAEVLTEADALLPMIEEARRTSPLPERPDVTRADALLGASGSSWPGGR
jgi:predicted nucleotidyltransferase